MMKRKRKVAPKRERFKRKLLRAWSKGEYATPTEIAMQVYDCKDRHIAGNIASENLDLLGFDYKQIMEKMGLTDEQDADDLIRLRNAKRIQDCDVFIKDENGNLTVNKNSNDFIEVDDNSTQLRALELTSKLKGRLNGHKNGITVNIVNQVRVNVAEVIKKHVKDPVTRNRIAEELDKLA